jgi:cyclopropane-fatty-acyl-phospholipid synthase
LLENSGALSAVKNIMPREPREHPPPPGPRATGPAPPPVRSRQAPSSKLERQLLRVELRQLNLLWMRVELWDGAVVQDGYRGEARILILERTALHGLLRSPSIGFGDGFSSGAIVVTGDLLDVLQKIYRSKRAARGRLLPMLWRALEGRRRGNTLTDSRDNIHSHYDLGNEFYRLWLDEKMVYTCAYYPHAGATLEAAQTAKLEHVARKLSLSPGQRVLELGCGWGALALHLARHHGAVVRAFNISSAQIDFARQAAREQGLESRVEFVEDDYRNAAGNAAGDFDRVVSVGMLEHVGPDNYSKLGEVIDRCLSADGLGLIHSIGRSLPRAMDPWIEKRIFPGAHPPTLAEMSQIVSPYGFEIMDVENLRIHYAMTCRDWLQRFEDHAEEVERMFDDYFVRAWRLYLSGSTAAFTTGALQLYQVLFARPELPSPPLTRAHLYRD